MSRPAARRRPSASASLGLLLMPLMLLLAAACKPAPRASQDGRLIRPNEASEPAGGLELLPSRQVGLTGHKARFKRRSPAIRDKATDQEHLSAAPRFAAPISNVSAVVGRDVRLVCTVDHLGQHQVSSGARLAWGADCFRPSRSGSRFGPAHVARVARRPRSWRGPHF